MQKTLSAASLVALAVCLYAAAPAHALPVIVDSGTPDETGNNSVFLDSTLPGGQYAAQQFSLGSPATVASIESYLGGSGSDPIAVQLTTSIGLGTVGGDVVSSFSILPPGTSPNAGAWVAAPVNLNLTAGTYYVVYSSADGDSGAFMPTAAPHDIGPSYLAVDNDINESLPPASNFFQVSSTTSYGLRILAIPEPATVVLALVGFIAAIGCRRRRRGG